MLWASTFILSTAWLFGPMSEGENEFAFMSQFAQAGHLRAADDLEERQWMNRVEVGVGVLEDTWLVIEIPYQWTRRSLGGRLHYDRSGLSNLRFTLGYQIRPATHMSIGLASAPMEFGTPISERFPDSKERFGELGDQNAALEWSVGHQEENQGWRWGLQGTLHLSDETSASSGIAEGHLLFRPNGGDLYLGPSLRVELDVSGGHLLELRAMERLNFAGGWSLELIGFTQVWTAQTDAHTGLMGGLRWRG